MFTRKYLALIGVAVWMCAVWPAYAQKMYRCGNAYQDRPCEGAQAGKVVNNWGGSSTTATVASGPCSRRGADAMKVVWARDNGALREQQIAEADRMGLSASTHEERVLIIESVYGKRGSAPEIRSAVEAECIADNERQAQASALAAAAARIAGGGAPAAPAASGPSAADVERMEARRQAEMEANAAAFKQSRCADLARQYENLRDQERRGGSAATMNRNAERRRELDDRQRREGC